MTTQQSTAGYDPFNIKPLQVRTRRIFAPSGGSISLTTAVFLTVTCSACFYLLVPLEYIRYIKREREMNRNLFLCFRPQIIGWNRTARAREALTKQHQQKSS